MSRAMHRSLFARIEAKRDDLVALTRDLIRFPTVNPPGEAYTPCAEYLGARLKARGFEVGYHRAEGETGDSARYDRKSTRLTPVTNAHLVCRLLLAKQNKESYQPQQ